MKFATVKSAAITGIVIKTFDLEISIIQGLPTFEISGLNNQKGQQCFSRVRAALNNNGFKTPKGRIICHLTKDISNSDVRSIDLALAIAILIADHQIFIRNHIPWFIVGQLGLSGKIQHIKGIFAMSRLSELEKTRWIIPYVNQNELQDTDLQNKYVVKEISEAVEIIEEKNLDIHQPVLRSEFSQRSELKPIYEILGQPLAKRALIIALSGWHPLLLIGSPGSGKTTLAGHAAYYMPQLNSQELEEVRSIHSIYGLWNDEIDQGLIRPFESPHHTVTQMGLIGGGVKLVPGIITYAHNGILFLDELSEFRPSILELLRQPLSEKRIELTRNNLKQSYPANFLLIGATNPCPCGYYLENDGRCKCGISEINRYRKKLSGALMDRFQLSVIMNDLPQKDLVKTAETRIITQIEIKKIQDQIINAQKMQKERCLEAEIEPQSNSLIEVNTMREFFCINKHDFYNFSGEIKHLKLSPRSYLAILRVARTIADLEGSRAVFSKHLHEAMLLRLKPDIF